MSNSEAFNPLDMDNLADSLVRALEAKPAATLEDLPTFTGAGLYALYYVGSFPAYSGIVSRAEQGKEIPLYVGKAVPKGARKGQAKEGSTTQQLRARLAKHARSIDAAQNLELSDFRARWLVTEQIWIPLGESALIQEYQPIWNSWLDGFGNNDPGKGRHQGKVSMWDTLHPGRTWAEKLVPGGYAPVELEAEVLRRIEDLHG